MRRLCRKGEGCVGVLGIGGEPPEPASMEPEPERTDVGADPRPEPDRGGSGDEEPPV